jgi:hypothetical protein
LIILKYEEIDWSNIIRGLNDLTSRRPVWGFKQLLGHGLVGGGFVFLKLEDNTEAGTVEVLHADVSEVIERV